MQYSISNLNAFIILVTIGFIYELGKGALKLIVNKTLLLN
ncbi:hypothetical protein GCM10023329_58530 [Streptomyces sanyensis]|uniref:Uncharacterized protein n=1 Tax=Streptomyces sanyensis TaxID=568869 RepID=A0ABP9BPK4_9ACTN